MRTLLAVGLAAPSLSLAQLLPGPTAERCEKSTSTQPAAAWLNTAAAAVLPASLDNRILRYRVSHDIPLWEQSDRMYEPLVPRALSTDRWLDLANGIEARQSIERPVAAGKYPTQLTT